MVVSESVRYANDKVIEKSCQQGVNDSQKVHENRKLPDICDFRVVRRQYHSLPIFLVKGTFTSCLQS
jgi:hypothetical protein